VVNPHKRELMKRKTGSLYLVRLDRFHKVGFTQLGAAKRLQGLQHASPFEVTLVREWPGSLYDEWDWHARLAEWRVRGEWYELPQDSLTRLLSAVNGEVEW
jgi:hypothetical protein